MALAHVNLLIWGRDVAFAMIALEDLGELERWAGKANKLGHGSESALGWMQSMTEDRVWGLGPRAKRYCRLNKKRSHTVPFKFLHIRRKTRMQGKEIQLCPFPCSFKGQIIRNHPEAVRGNTGPQEAFHPGLGYQILGPGFLAHLQGLRSRGRTGAVAFSTLERKPRADVA